MKRRPSLFRSTPPSPRTPSVTRMPRTLGRQSMPVASVLPAVAGNFVSAANSAGGEHNRLGPENMEPAAFTVISKRPRYAVAILQQSNDGVLHEYVDAEMDI